jgi:hypothetical protein
MPRSDTGRKRCAIYTRKSSEDEHEDADASWFAQSLSIYESGTSLDVAFGLPTAARYHSGMARRQRDALLAEMATRFFAAEASNRRHGADNGGHESISGRIEAMIDIEAQAKRVVDAAAERLRRQIADAEWRRERLAADIMFLERAANPKIVRLEPAQRPVSTEVDVDADLIVMPGGRAA